MAKGHANDDGLPDNNSRSGTPFTGAAKGNRSTRSKPYDANNSFVKKLSTKVSWIGKIGWFNNSQEEKDFHNEITEDHNSIEDRPAQPPPSKRPCIRMDVTHPPGTFDIKPRNRNVTAETDSSKECFSNHNETTQDFLEPIASGSNFKPRFVASTPAFSGNLNNKVSYSRSALNMLISQQNNIATNGTDDNSESGESTSGCSSLVPQNNKQDGQLTTNYNSSFPKKRRFADEKMSFTNHLQSPRSLFLDTTTRETLGSRQPSFNPLIVTHNSTFEKSSSLLSPFYPGNTMFGGANAANMFKKGRSLLANTSQLTRTAPNRASVEVNPSSNNTSTTDVSNMSVTARRILETLEQFSSPLSDAKKIPLRNVMGSNISNNTTLSATLVGNRKRGREDECDSPTVGLRHLARELTVPTVPDIMRIKRKQRMQNITVNARKIMSARNAANVPAVHEYVLRTEADNESKHGNSKLKATKNSPLDEEDSIIPINLPMLPLPIKNVPHFDLPLSAQSIFSSTSSNLSHQSKLTTSNNSFKFASPIRLDGEKNLESINNFIFSKPITPSKMTSTLNFNDSSDLPKTSKKTVDEAETDSCESTFQNFIWSGPSKNSPVKPLKEDSKILKSSPDWKNGSVIDFFKKDNENKEQLNVWECNECLIKNSGKISQCVACKKPKPDDDENSSDIEIIDSPSCPELKSAKSSKEENFDNSNLQKSNSSPSILGKISSSKSSANLSTKDFTSTRLKIFNTSESNSEQSKSTTSLLASGEIQSKSSASSESLSSPLKLIESKSSWECPCCMVRNLDNLNLCPCCNTAKPGSKSISPKRTSESSSVLSTSTTATTTVGSGFGDMFKKPEGTWTCDTCMIQNKEGRDKCAACETLKPGSKSTTSATSFAKTMTSGFGDKFKKPEGSWNCDSCMLSNKASDSKCVACENPKPGSEIVDSNKPKLQFNVDMPTNSGSFKFGIDKAEDFAKKTDDELPKTNGFCLSSHSSTNANFRFGVSSNTSKDDKDGFTFKPNESSITATFQFGTKPVDSDNKEDEKKITSVGFSFGAPPNENTKTNTGFVFGSPKKVDEEKKQSGSNAATFVFGSQSSNTSSTCNLASDKETKIPQVIPSNNFVFGTPKSVFGLPTNDTSASKNEKNESDNIKSTDNTKILSFESPKSVPVLSFGVSVASTVTNTTSKDSSISTSFPFCAQTSTPAATVTTTPTAQTEKQASILSFGTNSTASSTFSKQVNQSTQSLFGTQNSPPTSTETGKSLFGAPSLEKKLTPTFGEPKNKISSFGSSTENNLSVQQTFPPFGTSTGVNTNPLSFGSTDTTAVNSVSSPFGSSTNMFGSGPNSSFGANTTSNIFGATTKPADTPAASTSLFSFNQPSQSAASSTSFNFSSGVAATGSNDQKGIFSFGGSSTVQPGNGFGSSFGSSSTGMPAAPANFSFNSPSKLDTSSAFGQSVASETTPMFNSSNNQSVGAPPAYPGTTTPTAPASSGFNFGSANVPSSFSFGSTSSAGSGSGFNFNAPVTNNSAAVTFDPNAQPTFNFTAGTGAPNAFNAPSSGTMPVRKIKKAVRRMPRQ